MPLVQTPLRPLETAALLHTWRLKLQILRYFPADPVVLRSRISSTKRSGEAGFLSHIFPVFIDSAGGGFYNFTYHEKIFN